MIKTKNITPQVYYKNSRDFQVIGRVVEIMFNYCLTNINVLLNNTINDNTNLAMLDLFLLTVGFKQTHNYTSVDLLKLVQVFKSIVKIKGTKSAIEECIALLLRSQNIRDEFLVIVNTIDSISGGSALRQRDISFNELYEIDLFLPRGIKDTVLLYDLFDYILPAGFLVNIYNVSTNAFQSFDADVYTNYSAYEYWKGKTSNKLFSQITGTNPEGTRDGDINIGLISGEINNDDEDEIESVGGNEFPTN